MVRFGAAGIARGTTPEHIAAIARAVAGAAPRAIPAAPTRTMLAGLEPMILAA